MSDLCETCRNNIPWDRLTRHGEVKPGIIYRESGTFNPERCRVCRLFQDVYMQTPHQPLNPAPRQILTIIPELTVNRFQHRLSHEAADEGMCYLLTGTNPKSKKFRKDYARSQSQKFKPAVVKGWVGSCTEAHGEACRPAPMALIAQLRVMDCVEQKVVPAPHGCGFAALSYVWGKISTNESANGLPKTIVDAMTVAMRLGYRYLWIDRYCIDQEDANDKHIQINQMGAIYAAAQLTIVAAAGADPTYGLPGVGSRARSYQILHEQVGQNYLVALPTSAPNTIYKSRWASRAWTFQEGYLSKRRLFFTDRQAAFICNQDILQDGADHEIREDNFKIKLCLVNTFFPQSADDQELGIDRAKRYLYTYSRRQLSYDVDALNAISGILNSQSYQSNRFTNHIFGVPFEVVTRLQPGVYVALEWYHKSPCRRRRNMPSWSSLAWDGTIEWRMNVRGHVPVDYQLKVPVGDQYVNIEQLVGEAHLTAELNASRCNPVLEITAYVIELPRLIPYEKIEGSNVRP